MPRNSHTFAVAILFELSLGFVALLIAWLAGISLSDQLELTSSALLRGLYATLPMLAMLALLTRSTWPPIVEIKQQVEQLVRQLFRQSGWPALALVSLAAGLGEELLFRGALQPWIATWTTPWIALAVVSLLFGLAHALTTAYFVLATLIGLYFGWLAMAYEDLTAPIVAHSLYDFIALLYVKRGMQKN